MKKILLVMVLALGTLTLFAQSREGLTTYTLDNGLTVYLWEDHDQPDVTGYVATRAGSIDEPKEYTGLAHYLEHMLFKGTQKIGAVDWEKEKPLYEEIIRLYDEYAVATDPVRRDTLIQQINRASLEASKYATTEEFFSLLDGIGATGVNAGTSYDYTVYYNSFPGNQTYKWLQIFSERLINPVFRTFQAELENVFEEYNMYQDYPSEHTRNNLFADLYKGHPYERSIIGLPEHLKNPRLSKLIEFYETWYVPNNMALVIVGDFDTESIKPMIAETFGRLVSRELPTRPTYPETSFAGNPKSKHKVGYYPSIVWAYKGVKVADEDALALQFVCSLLSNGMNTGLLDKIVLDGDVQGASASMDARRDQGRILVQAIPYYDAAQRRYESNSATEKIVFAEINKLKNGQIEDWLINAVKEEYAQSFDLAFESSYSKVGNLVQTFIYELPLDDLFTQKDKIMALTKEDIQRVAKKYFDADYMTVEFDEGDPEKNKLAKPQIKPLDPIKGAETEYAKWFKQLPEGEVKITYADLNEVTKVDLFENVHLHYTPNPKNNIFTLNLRYKVGTEQMPMLEYAVALMNTAGIQPDTDAQQFRRQLAELGGSCSYGVSANYLNVSIMGKEENLESICKLVQRQIFMPKHDPKQLDAMKGSELSSRFTMDKMDQLYADATLQYVLHGEESEYIDVVPFMDIYYMNISQLVGPFVDATGYEVDAHYVGQKPVEEVKTILTGALPTQAVMKNGNELVIKDPIKYDKTQVYFMANKKQQQADLYLYIGGHPYAITEDIPTDAFNQYFSGGFSGLVLDEIRTKRSMAYSAGGGVNTPALQGKSTYFLGAVGTQHDKVADAVDVFMDLINNMPEHPERLENIKTLLRQGYLTSKPSFRNKSRTYAYWEQLGYTEDPAKVNLEKINNLTWEDVMAYYEANIKNQPVSIIIVGDPKLINMKQIDAKYGKHKKITKGKIFAPLDLE